MIICDVIDFLKTEDISIAPTEELSAFLKRHKCYYLLSKIKNNGYDTLINSIALKTRYNDCKSIFEQINFPYAIIKGAALSSTLYKNPYIRQSGDIDILISRNNVDELERILLSNGFIQGRITEMGIKPFSREEKIYYSVNTHQIAPFMKSTNSKIIPCVSFDVNLDILWGEHSKETDMSYVLEHLATFELFGHNLYKLSPEMEFVALCMHHYKDMNSIYLLVKGSLCLGLFCDVNDYICNVSMNLCELQEICEKLGVGKYVYECIKLTYQIFNNNETYKYLTCLKKYEDKLLDNTFGLNDKERKTWTIPLLERIFHLNLSEYIWQMLSEDEINKIKVNHKMI